MSRPLLMLFLLLLRSSLHAEPRPFAFTHVAVINVSCAPPQPDQAVIVTSNRVRAVGQTSKVAVLEVAQVIDAAAISFSTSPESPAPGRFTLAK